MAENVRRIAASSGLTRELASINALRIRFFAYCQSCITPFRRSVGVARREREYARRTPRPGTQLQKKSHRILWLKLNFRSIVGTRDFVTWNNVRAKLILRANLVSSTLCQFK